MNKKMVKRIMKRLMLLPIVFGLALAAQAIFLAAANTANAQPVAVIGAAPYSANVLVLDITDGLSTTLRYLPLIINQPRSYTGWAVGWSSDGYASILHTIDSGRSWIRQGGPGELPDANLESVSAIDADNAWAVGEQSILRTRDGGQTWESQALPTGLPITTSLCSIKAIDGSTAWAVGYPDILLHTTDGSTWQASPRAADLHLPHSVQYSDMDAADATHAWAVGSYGETDSNPRGELVIAFFDGAEWRKQEVSYVPSDGAAFIGVSALDQNTVWAVGGSGMGLPLIKTRNGGTTWISTTQDSPFGFLDINRVVAVSADMGWLTGDNGLIARTDDGGLTWEAQNAPNVGAYLFAISAANPWMAWAVGNASIGGSNGWLLRTIDGQTWIAQPAPVNADMKGISMVGARR